MKILFVSNELTRTGAPIMLLHFLRWLKENNNSIKFDLAAVESGSLLKDFSELAGSTVILEKAPTTLLRRIKHRLSTKFFGNLTFRRRVPKEISRQQYDLIYANTVLSTDAAVFIKRQVKGSPKLIVHVHELQFMITNHFPQFKSYFPEITYFIAASKLVAKNLTLNWGISESSISVIYETSTKENFKLLENDNIKSNKFIVGASGSFNKRKGNDIFLQLANVLANIKPNYEFEFRWIGKIDKSERLMLESDLEKMNLPFQFTVSGELQNPQSEFLKMNVFVLTSREDPFPLVCIEVGLNGVPIICFEKATGTAEVIIEPKAGAIVPYLNVYKMAEQIIFYYENRKVLEGEGKAAQRVFSEFLPDKNFPKIVRLIDAIV